uniref:ZF-HD dimerization-type domain-containing protein n=1 Tax=Kalanchoe fedtschenkoi TaxID=63787 RepID=A0A7N0TSU0_KALFE
MEFDDHHRHPHHHRHQRSEEEEDDEEEEEEASDEMLMMNSSLNTNTNHNTVTSGGGGGGGNNVSLSRARMVEALSQVQIQPAPAVTAPSSRPIYRECLKNHAINVMGHALDGCCEFMPAGPEGSLDALKCAACGCHRNFHRKEEAVGGEPGAMLYSLSHPHLAHPGPGGFGSYYPHPAPPGYLHLAPPRPLALPSSSGGGAAGGSQDDDVSNPNAIVAAGGSSNGKKRFRTKFTLEQKEKMLAMAERIGWRIQRAEEELVQQFCQEAAVKRHVFKVWMHNNKHTLGRAATTSNNHNNNNNGGSSRQQQLMD